MQKTFVFVGPTLSSEQVLAILPQARVLAPVAAGDLLRLELSAQDRLAIIDGYYFQSAAVRHKEILALLSRGVQVWGAASMGALRAAELAPFGMQGIGKIFTDYAQGRIEGDDEVALLHGPEDMRYPAFTAALVDIREECRCACACALLTEDEAQLILGLAASLPFQKRSYAHLKQLALGEGLAEDVAQRFFTFVRRQHATLKQQDALALLHHLQAQPARASKPTFLFQQTTFVQAWMAHEQRYLCGQETPFADTDLCLLYQLFGADYVQFHTDTLLTAILAFAARQNGDGPGVGQEDSPPIASTDQLEQRAATYLSEVCHFSDLQPLPACVDTWLLPAEYTLTREQKLARVLRRASFVPQGFEHKSVLLAALQHDAALVQTLLHILRQIELFNQRLTFSHPGFQFEQLSSKKVLAWFCQRWNVRETELDMALLDRGFADRASFIEQARPFYLFDKYRGVPTITRSSLPATLKGVSPVQQPDNACA